MDLFIQYGAAAGVQALDDSGLTVIIDENAPATVWLSVLVSVVLVWS